MNALAAAGVAWMVDKEIGQQKLEGGILADEMGLGKTVQMIATMVKCIRQIFFITFTHSPGDQGDEPL